MVIEGQQQKDGRFAPGNQMYKRVKHLGRPREDRRLIKALAKVLTTKDLETMLKTQLARAKAGDNRAVETLLSYAFGKPRQQHDITSGGEPLTTLRIIIDRSKGTGESSGG